ncbi:VanZ like family protein [Muriicola jejuensis]|uniref:VanZ family protein n=1 Tax=Muriicola jejuensis TaxID=504488 RepID=A0A6P0UGD9_9FLAO|nr:VanZ family protein [Muriicola jejuensis]NER11692.1 VanZ family protein [Muriicola jejuensis]SMP25423.1 VanZ like family protein [Muriicola jejuensis]
MAFGTRNLTEKHYWFAVVLVYLTILSTLFIGQPLANELRDQNVQAVIFVLGMLLVTIAVLLHGLIHRPGSVEYAFLIGIAAVYVMFFFRLGAPERSHLIEYSVLAVLLHKSFKKKYLADSGNWKSGIMAWLWGVCLGALDEGIQYFLPHRVFDPLDIAFNSIAVTMAIGVSIVLFLLKKVLKKNAVK